MKVENKKIFKELSSLGIKTEILASDYSMIIYRKKIKYLGNINFPLFPFNSYGGIEVTINKHLTKKILKDNGINTPKGFLVASFSDVLKKIKQGKLFFPLVVKPNDQTLGTGVFANITTKKETKEAILLLKKQNHTPFLVEEYFKGDDFRFLVLKGKVIAIAKRIPPFIVGDGKKTLKRLIGVLNKGKDKYKKLKIDEETLRNIKKQKVSLGVIIEKGRKIKLRENANKSTGGFSQDVTDKVHPRFKEIAIRATRGVDLNFAGVDLLIKDATSKNSSYVFLEINGNPGWSVHENPDIGRKRNITREFAWAILKEMKK